MKKANPSRNWPKSFLLERETRLELATFSLATRHSTTELLPQMEEWWRELTGDIMHRRRHVCQEGAAKNLLKNLPKISKISEMPSEGLEPTLYAA